ncbi:MAG: sensor domain-containing diguanylate cyclase [Deltaproteobacteria bacterium]|nr:sensor domain-containing diguanylate cyclase [Deltaproteobacteria bacterium]
MEPEGSFRGDFKRVFTVLFQITKKINEAAPLPELLRIVSRSVVDLVGADACSIMLLDEARAELLCKAAVGLPAQEEASICFKVGEGVAGWVAEHGAPALIADVGDDARFKTVSGQTTPIRALLSVPLATKEGIIGVISATSARPAVFSPEHEELLLYLGASIVKDIENARLFRQSITDSLTKAFNRQYLYQRLPGEVERSRRYGDPLSVALFDIDHFRRFNDSFGRPAGDFVLKEVVRLGQEQIRDVDALVRYGGEELLFLLPNTSLAGAQRTAERFRETLQTSEFGWSDRRLQVTVSAGVAQLCEEAPTDEALLRKADDALWRAKKAGRNRVEPAS